MFEFITEDDRGQVGIGTLIVFIAMVLVAAIAAGVLINTAGFLQSQSEQTGEESTSQVTDRVQEINTIGNVTPSEDGVNQINVSVMKGSGAADIDLSKLTIEYIGPNGADTLTYDETDLANSSSYFQIDAVRGTEPVAENSSDRFVLVIDLGAAAGDNPANLQTGQTASLRITTASGATTSIELRVPDSVSGESAVEL
ncbi:archaellin/type IV pilin N-terminal domain-containing protein [Haloparvum sp. PAK95]|uniref:archaellin/type IV pilin N-terminal domain-containing protein n=1 Tax=Haloparvum sp. PAK95 TaxID=3418962 RepID=UPI003D2EA5E5